MLRSTKRDRTEVKRLTLLGTVLLTVSILPGPAAQADSTVPIWARKTASLESDPLKVVGTAPTGEPLRVVITRRTANGPSIESVVARTKASAAKLIGSAQRDKSAIAVEMAQPVKIAAAGPDPLRPRQWAHDLLHTSTAWKAATGVGVVVAVVDTGVQANHPDLAGRVLKGYDFVFGDATPDDQNGHGTHVAGIIAANTYNRIGIAGMTKAAKVLPVRVLDARGEGDSGTVSAGIKWAVDHGADVINLSLAGPRSSAESSAVAYAISKGVVVVAAAGNNHCALSTTASYPAADPGVIGVGAVTRTRAIADYSSCGSWVDVSAPGGDAGSDAGGIWSTYKGSGYVSLSGTSMATPYVAATAALAVEEIGPGWTPAGVAQVLTGTATDLGAVGRDDNYGSGLINPVAMLNHINTHFTLSVPSATTIAPGAVPVSGRLLLTDGTPVPSARVSISTTLYGKKQVHTVTTDANGAFTTTYNLPHNVTFAVVYGGSGATDNISKTIKFTHVAPKWTYTHTSSKAYVTNYSIYRQKLALQKRSGSTWKTVKSTTVTTSKWSATAGKGTWRLVSYANASLASRVSAAWTN